jgi:hypothetical protein
MVIVGLRAVKAGCALSGKAACLQDLQDRIQGMQALSDWARVLQPTRQQLDALESLGASDMSECELTAAVRC